MKGYRILTESRFISVFWYNVLYLHVLVELVDIHEIMHLEVGKLKLNKSGNHRHPGEVSCSPIFNLSSLVAVLSYVPLFSQREARVPFALASSHRFSTI